MDELGKAKELYNALHGICLSINSTLEIDVMMRTIVVESARALRCESSLMAVLQNGRWVVRDIHNLPPDIVGTASPDEASLAGLAEKAGKPVHISDTVHDARASGYLKNFGIRSVLAIPLSTSGDIPGVLFLNYHSKTAAFTDTEMDFADKISSAVSLAFRNASLLERSRHSEKRINRANEFSSALNNINTIIHSSLDYDEIMRKVVMETALAIGAESAIIYLKENSNWRARYVYGLPEEIVGRPLTDEEIKYSVRASMEKQIIINDASRDSRVHRETVEQYGIRAILDVALIIGSYLIGDFVLHYHEPGREFDELTVDFVNKVAASLTLALKNARLYEERRLIIDALRESEERFRSAFTYAPFGMALVGVDGRVMKANRSASTLFGYAEQEFLNKTYLDLSHPDDLEACTALMRDLIEGKRNYGWLEKRLLHKDGHVIWALLSASLVRDEKGNPRYFVSQVQDTTDRKRAEEALKRASDTGEQLQRVMVAISSSRSFEDALKQLLDAALRLTGMDGGGVYLVEKGVAVLRYCRDLPPPFIREVERLPMDSPVVKASENQVDLFDFVEEFREMQELFRRHGIRHAFSIPLRVGEETFGFLNVGSTRTERPERADIQTLSILATETESLLHRLLIESALRESEERFRGAFTYAAVGMSLVRADGRMLQVNRSLCKMFGYSEQELLKKTFQELTHPDDMNASLELLNDLAEGRRDYGWLEKRYIHRQGQVIWALLSVAVMRDERGKAMYFVAQTQDITDRKRAEEALRESRAKLGAILNNTPAAVYMLDEDGRFIHVNRRFEELFGITAETATGSSIDDLFPREIAALLSINNRKVLEGRTPQEFEEVIPRADGPRIYASVKSPLLDPAGRPYAIVGISTDITERKKMEEEIRHMANHDALTGLPNRRFFMDIIEIEVAQARRNRTKLAILFLDLDRFKEINDTLGHEAGDDLLRQVAARVRADIRASDTLARIGGDEFNIILADIARPEDITVTLRKIMDSFRRPFLIAGHELHVTTSIGVSIYPDDSRELDTLFRFADIALYQAKDLGKNSYYFYNPAINIRSVERIRLENDLRQTLKRGELDVYYQPQIDITSRQIVCAEALVRWRHPERGILGPKRFISAAEDTGFIASIDEYVLRTACSHIRSWLDSGLSPVCVTVNLSAREFQNPELVNKILSALREAGAPPEYLDVEITESLAMSNIERTIGRLSELAENGIHTSIDDFGTGYSSLSYLKRLPIYKLKIDQSFIKDIATNPDDRAIISAVTAMAHSMKIKVLAEGVETEEQLAFLNSTRCDEAQGYLFSRPLPADEFKALLIGAGR